MAKHIVSYVTHRIWRSAGSTCARGAFTRRLPTEHIRVLIMPRLRRHRRTRAVIQIGTLNQRQVRARASALYSARFFFRSACIVRSVVDGATPAPRDDDVDDEDCDDVIGQFWSRTRVCRGATANLAPAQLHFFGRQASLLRRQNAVKKLALSWLRAESALRFVAVV